MKSIIRLMSYHIFDCLVWALNKSIPYEDKAPTTGDLGIGPVTFFLEHALGKFMHTVIINDGNEE